VAAGPPAAPHAFVNAGPTGSVIWAGGGGAGAHGNEGVGSIQARVRPLYSAGKNPYGAGCNAWVRDGTGSVSVTRSWVGVNAGDQGNGHFLTAGAADRINAHEVKHVQSSLDLYTEHLGALEGRISDYRRGGLGENLGTNPNRAAAELRKLIKWRDAIAAFQDTDRAANRKDGAVDSADLTSGTYPCDDGAGTVGGKAFQHRVRLPGEAPP
jgi:hypothetical protein